MSFLNLNSKYIRAIKKIYPIWKESNFIYKKNKNLIKTNKVLEVLNANELNIEESLNLHINELCLHDIFKFLITTVNSSLPLNVHNDIDEIYFELNKNRKIVNLPNSRLILYKGDITLLAVDSIVNAGNSMLLGCFIPFHKCIDNIIHFAAGPRLREECRLFNIKNELSGLAKITKGYHLPAKHVIHTVGPIYKKDVDQSDLLNNCYVNSYLLAKEKMLNSIAFHCISTGEFGYPKEEAAEIACKAIKNLHENIEEKVKLQVVFNVFTDEDLNLYRKEILKFDLKYDEVINNH